MRGTIHHIEFYVKDLAVSRTFYQSLLGKLSYQLYQEWEQGFSFKLGDTYLVFVQVEEPYQKNGYHRKNIGLNHLAFSVDSYREVDELREYLLKHSVPLLYDEKYPFAGGEQHYAVFFEDPDRMKLEVAVGNTELLEGES